MSINDMEWEINKRFIGNDTLFILRTELGKITVLDRSTGFGWRDIESGFKDLNGEFWLASGNFDVRTFNLNFEDSVKKIKANANTCVGKE